MVLTILMYLADLELLLAMVLKPFSDSLSWEVACSTAEWYWGYMQRHWERTLHAGEALTISGDEIPQGEPAVIISNHLGYSDYYLIQALAMEAGMLGRCRYFAKKELVWRIPVFGWALWAIGMILVSRHWTTDATLIEEAFARVKRSQHPVWIVLYPEGTRRTKEKIQCSQAFAKLHGKPVLRNVLQPRTRGFASTIQGLHYSHVKFVYDLTFLYTSAPPDTTRIPSLAEQLGCGNLAQAGYGFHIHVQRIPIKDLPVDEAGLREWCEDAWRRKDRILEDMLEDAALEKVG